MNFVHIRFVLNPKSRNSFVYSYIHLSTHPLLYPFLRPSIHLLVQACILLSIYLTVCSWIQPPVHRSIHAPIIRSSRRYYLCKGILIFRFIQEAQHILWLWQTQSCYIHFGVLVVFSKYNNNDYIKYRKETLEDKFAVILYLKINNN